MSNLEDDLSAGDDRVVAKRAKLSVHFHDSLKDDKNGDGLNGVVVSDLS